jgi:gamma-glutamyltranspeptidase / glutathione hydrolase
VVMSQSGAPYMAVGSVGGYGILQTVPQMISHAIDFQLNPQAALEAPRVRVLEGYQVMLETRIPAATRTELSRRGHQLHELGEWAFGEGQLGRGQMIVRDASGVLFAGSDPRADGAALAV